MSSSKGTEEQATPIDSAPVLNASQEGDGQKGGGSGQAGGGGKDSFTTPLGSPSTSRQHEKGKGGSDGQAGSGGQRQHLSDPSQLNQDHLKASGLPRRKMIDEVQ